MKAKAILVIDMPKNCDECTLNCDGICGAEQEPVHSIVCPLKPMPQSKNDRYGLDKYAMGWNECLKEIEE